MLPCPAPPIMDPAIDAPLILVVDDNPDAAESLALVLELEGFRTATAHDGASALAQHDAARPDARLLDLGLPDLDGRDVARRIRERGAPGRPALIAISGLSRPEEVDASRAAGFDAHLVKPVAPDAIVRVLAGLGLAAPAG